MSASRSRTRTVRNVEIGELQDTFLIRGERELQRKRAAEGYAASRSPAPAGAAEPVSSAAEASP